VPVLKLFASWCQLLKLYNTDIFQNIYLNLLLMHAQVGTELRCVSPDMYESFPDGNREMHRIPYFRASLSCMHGQHQPESAEIVYRFGNHKRALRTSEGELVGITPAAATFLAERLFTGGSVSGIRLLVQDGTPLQADKWDAPKIIKLRVAGNGMF